MLVSMIVCPSFYQDQIRGRSTVDDGDGAAAVGMGGGATMGLGGQGDGERV